MEQKSQQVIYRSFPSHTSRKCQLPSDYLGLAQAIRRLSKAPTVYLPTHMLCNYTCTSFLHIKCAYMCAYQTACVYTAHQYMRSIYILRMHMYSVLKHVLHTTSAHDWHELHTYTCSLYLGTKALPKYRKFRGCGLGCSFGCRSSLNVYFSGSAKFTIQPHHLGKYIWTHISHACFGSNRGHIS